nr:bifunctional oligoribonuclease/PAP phosphatase NrnA [candidate division Zixibacteria bacterium]
MMTINKDIERCIQKAESILVTAHVDPDGDSIGTQLAFRRYLTGLSKKVSVINDGVIPEKYTFLPDIDKILNADNYRGRSVFDLAIILECPRPDRIGLVSRFITENTTVINIDHHPDNTGYGDVVHLDSRASAVGEILTEYFLDVGFTLDTDTATLLYTGILTDTGRFRYDSTTRRTMEIAGLLIEAGADSRRICDRIYYSMSEATLHLTAEVFSRIKLHDNNRICLINLDHNLLRNPKYDCADIEGMAEYTLYGRGVLAGALLKEIRQGQTKVSLRSRDIINVSRIAAGFGGGGHINAAGYTVDLPADKAASDLLNVLKEAVHDSV